MCLGLVADGVMGTWWLTLVATLGRKSLDLVIDMLALNIRKRLDYEIAKSP